VPPAQSPRRSRHTRSGYQPRKGVCPLGYVLALAAGEVIDYGQFVVAPEECFGYMGADKPSAPAEQNPHCPAVGAASLGLSLWANHSKVSLRPSLAGTRGSQPNVSLEAWPKSPPELFA
jgi:hypothetical protein